MVQHYFVAGWAPTGGEREFFANQVSSDLYSAGVILPVAEPHLSGTRRGVFRQAAVAR